jgi:hypothetical protein
MREKQLGKDEDSTKVSRDLKFAQKMWKVRELELRLKEEKYRNLRERLKLERP